MGFVVSVNICQQLLFFPLCRIAVYRRSWWKEVSFISVFSRCLKNVGEPVPSVKWQL